MTKSYEHTHIRSSPQQHWHLAYIRFAFTPSSRTPLRKHIFIPLHYHTTTFSVYFYLGRAVYFSSCIPRRMLLYNTSQYASCNYAAILMPDASQQRCCARHLVSLATSPAVEVVVSRPYLCFRASRHSQGKAWTAVERVHNGAATVKLGSHLFWNLRDIIDEHHHHEYTIQSRKSMNRSCELKSLGKREHPSSSFPFDIECAPHTNTFVQLLGSASHTVAHCQWRISCMQNAE